MNKNPFPHRASRLRVSGGLLLLALAPWSTLVQAGCEEPPAQRVNWLRCDKSGADLRGADLREAVLTQANLSHAQLAGVRLLSNADLGAARF